jgi:hypothetical protein
VVFNETYTFLLQGTIAASGDDASIMMIMMTLNDDNSTVAAADADNYNTAASVAVSTIATASSAADDDTTHTIYISFNLVTQHVVDTARVRLTLELCTGGDLVAEVTCSELEVA